MGNRRCWLVLVVGLAALFVACGSGNGGAPDAVVEPPDAAGDATGDASLDTTVDPGDPDPASWCAPADFVALASPLLPNPWRVLGPEGGDFLRILTRPQATLVDGDASDAAWLDRILVEVDALLPAGNGMEVTVVVHPSAEWADLVATCVPDLPESDESHYLRLRRTGDAGLEIHLFAPAEAGRRMAWQTIRQILLGAPVPAGGMVVADAPATPLRGVIETFYGPPWTPEARIALMPTLAALKFNTFIYASKMDLFTNWLFDYWKEDWEPVHLAELGAMVDAAKNHGLLVGIQVRPLDSVTFSSQDDRAAFVDRVGDLLDVGFDLFSLSFDDTDRVLGPQDTAAFASYDHAVIAFAADVLARLHQARPDLVLGFVPNDYWSEAPTAQATLTLAGQQLPSYVTIGWTGLQIIPATITAQDADQVAAWMQRKPLLGDNYPVLDHAGADLFLGPLEGRAADLPGHVAGLFFNPMPYPFASLPGLATCADYAWNAADYVPDRSVASMAEFLAGPGDAAKALAVLADVDRSPTLGSSPAPGLQAAIAAFWDAYDAGSGLTDASMALDTGYFQPFVAVGTHWASVWHPALRDELAPWATQLAGYGQAGRTALVLLARKAQGDAPGADELADWQQDFAALRARTPRPTAHVMQDFLDHADQALVPGG